MKQKSSYVPKCLRKNDGFFENVFGRERARRGSSGRETGAKLTAMAFSSLHFFVARGQQINENHQIISKTPDPPPQAADML